MFSSRAPGTSRGKKYCSPKCGADDRRALLRDESPDRARWFFHLGHARLKSCELCPSWESCLLTGKARRYCPTRNSHWNPTLEEFIAFTSQACAYCGRTEDHVGVDRYDNALGYVGGNVRPCCWKCNDQKNSDSVAEWEGRCRDQAYSWMVATFGEEKALSFFYLDFVTAGYL
jgi:hypothetical protein